MSGKSKKQPSAKHHPADTRDPRTAPGADPTRNEQETVVWAFGIADLDGPWGWRSEASRVWWRELLPKLRNFETMTWEEIMAAAGGRTKGNNHHFVNVKGLSSKARARLAEVGQEDVSELFSLRLTSTTRVYGIRDRRALKLLWYDRHHGSNQNAVHPVRVR